MQRLFFSNFDVGQQMKSVVFLGLLGVSCKLAANVGSYTQVRIAGDFLSSRKAARAERCPPKTTAAGLDG